MQISTKQWKDKANKCETQLFTEVHFVANKYLIFRFKQKLIMKIKPFNRQAAVL